MKKLILLWLLVVLVLAAFEPAGAGQGIVVIQSHRVKPYEQAMNGFRQICQSPPIKRLVISERKGIDIRRKIEQADPSLVLAIGMQALSLAKTIKDIPVVYLMVLNPQSILAREKNVTGVSMNIPPEKHLNALIEALPGAQTIGLLYDPGRSGRFVAAARKAAAKMQVRLVAAEIHDPGQAPSMAIEMKDTIDVFWMLPDLTVITPETVEFLLLFSFENRIPLFTFSEKYVEMGAFLSMDVDAFDMGRQAGEMALKILAGEDVSKIKHTYARKAIVSANVLIARKLGIPTVVAMNTGERENEKIFRTSQVIY